jgi:transposase InsO family protein
MPSSNPPQPTHYPSNAQPELQLPAQWSDQVKSGILCAIAAASSVISAAHARVARRHPLRAELDRAQNENRLLREELAIKDGRWKRAHPRRRPHYSAVQRLRILQLRAARGWTMEKTARRLLVDLHTLKHWNRRVDEHGERELIQTPRPVNRYPQYVRHLVRELSRTLPAMGCERVAQLLAPVGLMLSAASVRRFQREPIKPRREPQGGARARRRAVARGPGDVWHTDLTAVPFRSGFWVPWFPSMLPQRWPFCWWVAVVVDQMSRRLIAFEAYRSLPPSEQIQTLLQRALREQGFAPRCIVSDKGSQFNCKSYRRWCSRRGIRVLFGFLGQPHSIPITERFIRSMKQECFRRIVLPVTRRGVLKELGHYQTWYNEHRPHRHLDGRTPLEISTGRLKRRPRIETRPRWPHRRGSRGVTGKLALDVSYVGGRKHLPVIELRRVA